jgi:hypothetical protein
MPGVFPGHLASVIRNTDTGTELTMMRCGMPPMWWCRDALPTLQSCQQGRSAEASRPDPE